MNPDFVSELCQLLTITSRIAVTIGTRSHLPNVPEPSGQDVFWLADSICTFGNISDPIRAGNWEHLFNECGDVLRNIEHYRMHGIDPELGNPMVSFKRSGVELQQLEHVIRSIQEKALAAYRADQSEDFIPNRARTRARL